ncbi:MAG: hypothetical protein AVDCRST_MAG93-2454 [uncultured Chloroflexia bacterium]|uniref:Uncharacterized protein n=1 Tax=uncultured Chloroflexia bacterium TaxID=1672391 RepID=A0A6J4J3I0_9CHLR|nr:MAG: hypothetical protein AVDCRST_MAG93-2454 [uncultured Chloroflexia bacterium]
MKRIVSVLAVMGLMAAMMVASAMPAFAASEKGNCVGILASQVNQVNEFNNEVGNGLGGRLGRV